MRSGMVRCCYVYQVLNIVACNVQTRLVSSLTESTATSLARTTNISTSSFLSLVLWPCYHWTLLQFFLMWLSFSFTSSYCCSTSHVYKTFLCFYLHFCLCRYHEAYLYSWWWGHEIDSYIFPFVWPPCWKGHLDYHYGKFTIRSRVTQGDHQLLPTNW